MQYTLLSQKFPGEYSKKDSYEYYLPGNIFLAKDLKTEFKLQQQLERATLALGKFSAKITNIPNINFFISSYLKKEATQSSKIEGTQTEIDEAFQEDANEIATEKRNDWRELQQYTIALKAAIQGLTNLPLCGRLIRQTHKILLSQNRGKHKSPGEYRQSQNWIGGSRPDNAHFVPPPPKSIGECMKNLEDFIHDSATPIPDLIKIALIHYQFETIHPFLDGNGRIGRMLIPLYLLEKKILDQPILYISDFFEKNRNSYYDALDRARDNQAGLIKWISFFLDGVISTANEGMKTTKKITELEDKIYKKKLPALGKKAKNGQKLAAFLFQQPFVNSIKVRKELEIKSSAAQTLLAEFVTTGILQEITGQKRNRVFVFEDYLKILRK